MSIHKYQVVCLFVFTSLIIFISYFWIFNFIFHWVEELDWFSFLCPVYHLWISWNFCGFCKQTCSIPMNQNFLYSQKTYQKPNISLTYLLQKQIQKNLWCSRKLKVFKFFVHAFRVLNSFFSVIHFFIFYCHLIFSQHIILITITFSIYIDSKENDFIFSVF